MPIRSKSDDENKFVPPAITKKAGAKVPRPVQTKPKPKSQGRVEALGVAEQNTGVKPVATRKQIGQRLNGNNVRISDLPEFALENWRRKFLPTLYDKFFTSDEPFDAFNANSTRFVALLQVIVQEVYLDVKYTVTASDAIHFLVRTEPFLF